MKNKKVSKKDIAILLKLNLLDFLDQATLSEEKKKEFMKNFAELSWAYFFEQEGKELSEDEVDNIRKLFEEKKYKEVEELLVKKYEHFNEIMIKNSMLAKKTIILMILEEEMTRQKAHARLEKKRDRTDHLDTLIDHAYHDRWKNFISTI